MNPKVSIITVTFNCESTVERTLLSIKNQTYRNKELIVIDGNSTDNTLEIIRKYSSDISVLVSEKDRGIFDAMNKGIHIAGGEWIMFMNSGDLFSSRMALVKVQDMLQNPNCGVIYSPHFLRYKSHNKLVDEVPFFNVKTKYRPMGFSHQSTLVRTALAAKYGFEAEYKLSADYKMMWNLFYEEKAVFLKSMNPMAIMDDTGGETVSKYRQHLRESYSICGYRQSLQLRILIEVRYYEFRLKRLIKFLFFK